VSATEHVFLIILQLFPYISLDNQEFTADKSISKYVPYKKLWLDKLLIIKWLHTLNIKPLSVAPAKIPGRGKQFTIHDVKLKMSYLF
jgi:hypothetical protein